jgi:AcrR family transcriptional regulator
MAIRRAAAELFIERSPSSVSLRQIADRAGVNYGLIHHYFRTKEALLGEVFADFSARGADLIAEAPSVREAMATFLPPEGASSYSRMLAWAVLDGARAEQFHQSPAFQRIRELVEREWRDAGVRPTDVAIDSHLVTAAAMATILGWRFFQPFLASAGELGDRDEGAAAAEVIELLSVMIRAVAEHP